MTATTGCGRLATQGIELQRHQVEVRMEALERFLEQRLPKLLPAKEAAPRVWRMLAPEIAVAPPDEDLPSRIMVVWRLARTTAKLVGMCADNELLEQATQQDPSPWYTATKPRFMPSQQQAVRRNTAAEALLILGTTGLPLLPTKGDIPTAQRWAQLTNVLVKDLGIDQSSRWLGHALSLMNWRTCALSGVTPTHVIMLEELLVDEAQRVIVESGERAVFEHFRREYHLTRQEAADLIKLARADAMQLMSSSVEEDRAIMVAQLKDLAARSKEEMNADRELKVLKQLATIQGLTRSDPEDRAAEFLAIVAHVSKRQDAIAAKSPLQMLPQVRDIEYTVVPDEDEADYDQENG